MKKLMTFFAALVLAAGVSAQELEYLGEVAGWEILLDPTLGNGCLIQAEYDNDTVVRIGFDLIREQGYLTIFDDDWGDIEDGGKYPVEFDLDDQRYTAVAEGLYVNGVSGADIYFDNPDFLWDLARKYTLTMYAPTGEEVVAIRLDGTYAALETAVECQDIMSE